MFVQLPSVGFKVRRKDTHPITALRTCALMRGGMSYQDAAKRCNVETTSARTWYGCMKRVRSDVKMQEGRVGRDRLIDTWDEREGTTAEVVEAIMKDWTRGCWVLTDKL